MVDWRAWHERYDDPTAAHARRLPVVRRGIGTSLDRLGSGPCRAVSLCAGDGRDLIPELAARPQLEIATLLVEADAVLARRAEERAHDLRVDGVTVVVGDASRPAVIAPVLPVDLLVLCGIFGNVVDGDIRATVAAVPAMLSPGGYVVWTRGACGETDLRPTVRRWFVEAGLEEVAFDGAPELYGVGVNRATDGVTPTALPDRLFTFLR